MMRAVVVVATTSRYQQGAIRLARTMNSSLGESSVCWLATPREWAQWPTHQDKPYAFKAYALKAAMDDGAEILLWADAAILPIRSLDPLWGRIERDGYWIHNGGWNNGQWTEDSAYPDLFPECWTEEREGRETHLDYARAINRDIPHVVATTFGLNIKSEIGASILKEYFRLASETRAFCGPWWNSNGEREDYRKHAGAAPCGPPSTLGHRHDQTCLSVIAWRHSVKLTEGQEIFDYSHRRPDGTLHLSDHDERTILLADGAMHDGVVHG